MGWKQGVRRELKSVALTTLFFACWIGVLFVMKKLLLLEYSLATYKWTAALVGVLVLAKVVLVLEHVPVRRWLGVMPAWLDVVLRTALYALGVVVVLAVERGIKGWSEHGGFFRALEASLERSDPEHVWVNTIGVCSAILAYNVLGVVRRNVGDAALLRMFLVPMPAEEREEARGA